MKTIFGYIKPYKNDLKVNQYAHYKKYYCSLCTSLSKYGFWGRFILSYDLTYMLIILDSLSECKGFIQIKCPLHKRKQFSISLEALHYTSFINYWLTIKKLEDNSMDSRGVSSFFYRFLSKLMSFNKNYIRDILSYDSILVKLENALHEYYELEKKKSSFDDLSNKYANFMLLIFKEFFNNNKCCIYTEASNLINQIIINVSKLIYLADAFDDYFIDIARGNFNALITTKFTQDSEEKTIEQVFTIINCLQNQSYELINSIEIDNREIISNHIKWFDTNLALIILKQKGKNTWNRKNSFQTFIQH